MTPEEEKRLVKAAQGGSERAFEALFDANQKLVYNLAIKLTGNPDDALDVSQEAFIKAYKNLAAFRFESRFSAWLYRLTYNAAMDFLKKSKPAVSLTQEDGEGDEQELVIPDSSPGPEELVERDDIRRAVREAVAALPDDKREILIMREFSGMSYGDIAAALGLEEGTVKSRIARARSALAEILVKAGTFERVSRSNKLKGGK